MISLVAGRLLWPSIVYVEDVSFRVIVKPEKVQQKPETVNVCHQSKNYWYNQHISKEPAFTLKVKGFCFHITLHFSQFHYQLAVSTTLRLFAYKSSIQTVGEIIRMFSVQEPVLCPISF